MITIRHIAFTALGLAALSVAFLAGRLSHGEDPGLDSLSGADLPAGSRSSTGNSGGSTGGNRRELSGSQGKNREIRDKSAGRSESTKAILPGSSNTAEELLQNRKLSLFHREPEANEKPEADGNPEASGNSTVTENSVVNKELGRNKKLELNKEIGKALGLKSFEYQAVNQVLNDTMEKLQETREENVEIRQRSDSQLFMKIRSFHEEGADLRSSLEDGLRRQLGDERYASFMLMAEESLDQEYYQFGRSYQTISILGYNSSNDGASRIKIVDEVHIPQGSGTRTIIQTRGNYETLPESYQSYLDVTSAGASPAPESPTVAPTVSPGATPGVIPNPPVAPPN